MKNTKIKIAFLIAILLVISFFWRNNDEVVTLVPDEINVVQNDVLVTKETTDEDFDLKDSEVKNSDTTNGTATEENKEEKVIEEITKEEKPLEEQVITTDNKSIDEKDRYLTDPIPEGKPSPVELQDEAINTDNSMNVSLSVTCKTILNNMHLFNTDKLDILPEDGVIYPEQQVIFYEGESVFDVLLREMQANKIHMEFVMTPIYNSHYIEGINNIYEFDCGELSGWMYKVNGWFPNYGASRYQLKDGDVIELIYTCDLGRDIGGNGAVIGGGE